MSSNDKKPFSFGFSKKKKETKVLENSSLGLGNEPTTSARAKEHDLITSVQGKKVISAVPKEEPKELVIPLLKKNTWSIHSKTAKMPSTHETSKLASKEDSKPTDVSTGENRLDDAAVKEILSDAAQQNMEWEDRGNEDMGMSIPLLMQNKVPEGYETDDKLDVSIRPDEANDADYDQVPISQFGLAMIRGMGWKPGEGIGSKTEEVKILEPKPRPKGQGLGAAPKPPELSAKPKRPLKPGEKRQEERPIGFAKGVGVMLNKGVHKNMYGRIEGVDEDNAQLIIKLAIGNQTVKVSQYIAQIVDDHEYKKYSKDLSKLTKLKTRKEENSKEYYKSKTKEGSKEDKEDFNSRREEERRKEESSKKEKSRNKDSHKSRTAEKRRDERTSENEDESKIHRDKEVAYKKRRKHKENYKDDKYIRDKSGSKNCEQSKEYKDKKEDRLKEQRSSLSRVWLQPDLRVRFIDKVYKKGKYYMSKVNIEDVVTPEECTCKTDDGALIYNVTESMLETVIPKTKPGYVMIVMGKHKGKLGIIVDKQKEKQKADVQLLRDRDKIVHLHYEEICHYSGDIHNNEDF